MIVHHVFIFALLSSFVDGFLVSHGPSKPSSVAESRRYSDFLYPTDPTERNGGSVQPGPNSLHNNNNQVKKNNGPGTIPIGATQPASMNNNNRANSIGNGIGNNRNTSSSNKTPNAIYDVSSSTEENAMYEKQDLTIDELRDQVEQLLIEEEEAEREERQRLLTMRAQLLERKRKREQERGEL